MALCPILNLRKSEFLSPSYHLVWGCSPEILRKWKIIVFGHPEYYLRFGFVQASQYGLCCQWDGVPSEVFMVLILSETTMAGVSVRAKYRDLKFIRKIDFTLTANPEPVNGNN